MNAQPAKDKTRQRTCVKCGTIFHHGHTYKGKPICFACMSALLTTWNRIVKTEGGNLADEKGNGN